MSSTRVRVFLGACLLAIAITTVVGSGVDSVLSGAIGIAATIALLIGARMRPRDERAAGMAASVLGDALWNANRGPDGSPPFASAADVAYVAAYPRGSPASRSSPGGGAVAPIRPSWSTR